jgi:hypothetical protein
MRSSIMSLLRSSSRAERLPQSVVASTYPTHGMAEGHSPLRHRAEHATRRRRQNSSYTTGSYVNRSGYGGAGARQRRFRFV